MLLILPLIINLALCQTEQPNVISYKRKEGLFLWIHLNENVDLKPIVSVVTNLNKISDKICPPKICLQINEIVSGVGFGNDFFKQIIPREVTTQPFVHESRHGPIGDIPNTGGDIFVHAKCDTKSNLFDFAWRRCLRLLLSWNRDLSGFVDGTENPKDEEIEEVAVDKNTGGSYCLTQRWIHNLTFIASASTKRMENIIGRTRNFNLELKNKSALSHLARMTSGAEYKSKKPFQIYRQSLPYGTISDEAGLFFIAFANSTINFDYMLDRLIRLSGNQMLPLFSVICIRHRIASRMIKKLRDIYRHRWIYAMMDIILILGLLYFFVCSLDLLSKSFTLIGGRIIKDIFCNNTILQSALAKVMVGLLGTAVLQSSGVSTSIVVSMVASGAIDVKSAIPIIMGVNIGTSVTSTLISLVRTNNSNAFGKTFAAATVHDMFNLVTVLILLPVEMLSSYLYILTGYIKKNYEFFTQSREPLNFMKVIIESFTDLIIQLNTTALEESIASQNSSIANNAELVKRNCPLKEDLNLVSISESFELSKKEIVYRPCNHLFAYVQWSDTGIGTVLLVMSLMSVIAPSIRRVVNVKCPGCLSFLTGYLVILFGAVMTALLQSSSAFISAMLPLVSIGILDLEKMYELTLGSNVGTTITAIFAAFSQTGKKSSAAVQIALCHLFFNLSGIFLFYIVPFMRNLPIGMARKLGKTAVKYPWFPFWYLAFTFLIFPGGILLLGMAGEIFQTILGVVILLSFLLILLINVMQTVCPDYMPPVLRNWNFLPLWMHSLEPMDRLIRSRFGSSAAQRCIDKTPSNDTRIVISTVGSGKDDSSPSITDNTVSDSSTASVSLTF
ncbi:Sodium-dependent phosphate transport protein 2A [Trichinella spiralis]|uniref:Sodium-dependent phosphate transport protein 2A n=1 Tax=Trichinella spiralis TaxID=6334 RepID=A0ABR3KJV5_TRISP